MRWFARCPAGRLAGCTIFEQPLKPAPARRALHIAREQNWHFQAYQHDELLCEQDRPEAWLYSRISGVRFRLVPDLEPLLASGTTKAACVIDDLAEVDRAIAVMTRELAATARVTRSNPEFVELLDPDVSKAVGCEIVCARLGYSLADAVAFGDAPNDVELLNAAGFAVAVSTSRPEVHRSRGRHVCATGGRRCRRHARGSRAGLIAPHCAAAPGVGCAREPRAGVAVFRLFFAGLALVAIATQLISLAAKGTLDPVNYFSYFTIDSNLIATGVLIACALSGAPPQHHGSTWSVAARSCT